MGVRGRRDTLGLADSCKASLVPSRAWPESGTFGHGPGDAVARPAQPACPGCAERSRTPQHEGDSAPCVPPGSSRSVRGTSDGRPAPADRRWRRCTARTQRRAGADVAIAKPVHSMICLRVHSVASAVPCDCVFSSLNGLALAGSASLYTPLLLPCAISCPPPYSSISAFSHFISLKGTSIYPAGSPRERVNHAVVRR